MAGRKDAMTSPHEEPGRSFPLIRAFLRDIDGVVARGGRTGDIVEAVRRRLFHLIEAHPALPDGATTCAHDEYARHLLYGDPRGRYEVVVMAWAPGQATPIHDHAGIWCVEGVVQGEVDVTRFDLKETLAGGKARLEQVEVIHAGLGECGALIPPVEHHRIANPYARPALTIHVYGGRLRTCNIFRRQADHTYGIQIKKLRFTSQGAALASS